MIETLGWSLLHFVWQGYLGAGLYGLLLFLLRRASPNVRYLVACATLAGLAACPLVNCLWLIPCRAPLVSEDKVDSSSPATPPPIVTPSSPGSTPEFPVIAPAAGHPAALDRQPAVEMAFAISDRLRDLMAPSLPWIVAGWLGGVLALSLRLFSGWRTVQRVRRAAVEPASPRWQEALQRLASKLRVSRPVRLVESALVDVPTVIGWLRPAILLPASALAGLDTEQLEALLAHELAHIRRYDYLVNLIQTAIETLLFYHPAVWWVSRRIRDEREHCCDDVAVALCGSRATYVRALAVMEELRASPRLAVAANSGSLVARIRRLVRPVPDATRSLRWGASLISLTAALMLAGGCYFMSRLNADPAAPRRAGRDADRQKLRYTVDIKTDVIKADGARLFDPKAPEIKLGGDLWLTAKLQNDGDQPVRVYWGDYAYPKMYRFDVTHESGWKPPVTRDWPDEYLPRAAAQKYFAVIQPGKSASYDLLLTSSPGGNCEHCYFNRPGHYAIIPSLSIATDQILDEATGETRAVLGVWTGALEALPLILKVAGDPKVLDEGVRIRGKVLDAEGKPVPKALVTVQHRVASFGGFDGFVTLELAQDLTEAEGRFEFFRLPADSPSFELHVRHADLLPNRAVVFNNVPAGTKRRYEAKVTLKAGRSVRGRVVNSQGKPVADVRFDVGPQRHTYSDDEGLFTLTGLPPQGESHVNLWRRGYSDLDLGVPAAGDAERDWLITLRRDSEHTISGTAAFAGGEPLHGMQLVFEIEVHDKATAKRGFTYWERQAQTDERGHFTLVLPEPQESNVRSVTAFAPGERHLPTGIWRTTLGKVTPRQQDVKLVFDDTHSLAAEVMPVKPVPEAFSLRVQCESLAAQRLVAEIMLDHKGGAVQFKKLSPGKYRVTVAVMPNGYLTTAKEVEIAAVADGDRKPREAPDARLSFKFPDLRFGRLIGQVVTPDGEPAPQAQIHFDGRGMSGIRDLDANARFEFEQFPVGTAWLSPRLKGFDDRGTPAEVREGRTEVVQVVLKPLSEVMADVKGRILYEDGTPVLGAGIGAFNPRRVDEKGAYQVQVRSDQPTFSIDLKNADGRPRLEPAKRLAAPYQPKMLSEALNVTLAVEPGQTTRCDIILDRTQLGRVTVNWKGPETNVQVTVSVVPLQSVPRGGEAPKVAPPDKGEKTLDDQLLFSQHMFVTLEKNGKLVLPDVPHGRRTVVMWPNDFSSARFRVLPAAQADVEVTFDPDEDGGIQFRLLDAAGKSRSKTTFELGAIIPGQAQRLRIWRSPGLLNSGAADDDLPPSPYARPDGSFLIEHLQPGRYELLLREGNRSKLLAIEVKPRETTKVDVRVDELKVNAPESP